MKCDLVTSDCGIDFINESLQEQEMYNLIIAQIVLALKIQQTNGSFVLKLFEMFTPVTVKLVILLKHFYKKVFLYKPLMSRSSNSERYVICKEFKSSKNDDKIIEELEKIIEYLKEHKDAKLNNIFPDFEIPTPLQSLIAVYNSQIANQQFKMINLMMKYIDGKDYHGEEYFYRRGLQIEASNFWLNLFYPKNSKDYVTNKNKFQDILANIMKNTSKDAKELNKKIIS